MSSTYKDQLQPTTVLPFTELYDITSNQFPEPLFLTPYPQSITYNNNTYTSCVMERSEFTNDQNDTRSVVISFALKQGVALTFLNYQVYKIRVKITRYFLDSRIARVIFVGEGESIGISDRILAFKCNDLLSLSKAVLPRLIYSSYCNHTLYSQGCNVLPSLYAVRTIVTYGEKPTILRASAFGTYPDNYFTYGYVDYRGQEYRLITYHNRAQSLIYIHAPFDTNINGKEVVVYAGCDKTARTCKEKFNNLENFLGFPYIPSKNPVIWGIA